VLGIALPSGFESNDLEGATMTTTCRKQQGHSHVHGPSCGHTAIRHNGHTDYLHEGQLHHLHADHVDEHILEIGSGNRDT